MKVMVLGGSGMLGHQVIKGCIQRGYDWHTIVRSKKLLVSYFGDFIDDRISLVPDVKDIQHLKSVIEEFQPEYIINCVGVVKQSSFAKDHLESIYLNSLLPHQLEEITRSINGRLIHISTDCVFDGQEGKYSESSNSNALDLYGKSKHLGEVDYGAAITIRTSIIGHELNSSTHGLIEWFLAQEGPVNGFTKAIFSGLTTLELTNVIFDVIISQNLKSGLYHVAAEPVSKYDLLKMTAAVYEKEISIIPSEDLVIDRSLDATRFNELTGYECPAWPTLLSEMREDYKK